MLLKCEMSQKNVTFSNVSASSNETLFPPVSYTVLSVFTLLTFISGIVANAALLFLILRSRRLRRMPFNVYLLNLLGANIINTLISYPMDLLSNLHSSQWLIGNAACTAYLYNVVVLQVSVASEVERDLQAST